MTHNERAAVTVLGLGAMGQALASALVRAEHPTTVWDRSPGKADTLASAGARVAKAPDDAVSASRLVVACLFDHDSVHEVLDPIAVEMRGQVLVNVTTTTPKQSRELATWAAQHGIDYLDGGIMAVPEMIGQPGSAILYSGSASVFDEHKAVLDQWGESSYFGADAGLASLYDLAMLSGMYAMFAGFIHGAAMVGSEGLSAKEFASRTTPFIAAMTGAFAGFAEIIDDGDYSRDGQQSLEFSDLGDLVQASTDQGVSDAVIAPIQALIKRQIAAGHGTDGFVRIYEEIRSKAS